MNHDDIAGKRVLVTAAATGIGATIAARFAERRRATCTCATSTRRRWPRTSPTHPDIAGRHADVASAGDVEAFVAAGVRHLGGLDVLVSNAGVAGPAAPVEEMDADGWRRTLDVNLTGAFLCVPRGRPAPQGRRRRVDRRDVVQRRHHGPAVPGALRRHQVGARSAW